MILRHPSPHKAPHNSTEQVVHSKGAAGSEGIRRKRTVLYCAECRVLQSTDVLVGKGKGEGREGTAASPACFHVHRRKCRYHVGRLVSLEADVDCWDGADDDGKRPSLLQSPAA